jgi:hypothetical protein
MSSFSPDRERAWRAQVVARLQAARFGAPAWVLCPRDGARRALERSLAERGGAFARFVNVDELAHALDARLGLAFARSPTEHDRAGAVERCLASRAVVLSGDGAAGAFRTALALLPVIDRLRAHGWDGAALPPDGPALTPGAAALVASHVELLGDVLMELEASLLATSSLDTIARLRRVLASLARSGETVGGLIALDGVDRLAPLERDVLLALRERGAEVIVAPWVRGWPLARLTDLASEPSRHPLPRSSWESDGVTADGLLAALDQGASNAARDDGSVTLATARDPFEEAELVARWIAERCARGAAPEDHAVLVEASTGALDRVRRALDRYGVPAHGAGAMAARETTPWQVFRASVRLAWTGVDAVDLMAVLSAPGAGIWGGDRDRLCALLRRETPADWAAVRALLVHFATPPAKPAAAGDEVADPDPADVARQAQVLETCRRVEELVALWSSKGPFRTLQPAHRFGALKGVVQATLARFMNPLKFADAIEGLRTQTLWIEAVSRVAEASRAALARWERSGAALPAEAPEAWLSDVAAMLGTVTDGAGQLRGDGVQLLAGEAVTARRPRVLVVTGFQRGRFPTPTPRDLLLGPLERAWLASASADLATLPDDADLADDARRDTLRALSLASERVLLVAPRRTADGSEVDVALAWRDLLAMLPDEHRRARARAGATPLRAWIDGDLDGPRATARARRAQSLRARAEGRHDESVALAKTVTLTAAARDFFAACDAPDRSFAVGDLVRDRIDAVVHTTRSLEALLTCRYAFLTGTLLGLRALRLARGPSLSAGDRARVAYAALRHRDAHPEETGEAGLRAALDAALARELPWADASSHRMPVMELRRAVERFLRRYGEMRDTLGLDGANEHGGEAAEPVVIPLPGERARAMRVKPGAIRVERSDLGGAAVLVDLRSGGRRVAPALIEAGLDVESVIAPMVAEASSGAGVAAVLRVSVSRAHGEYVPRPKNTTREEHRDRVLGDIARALDALAGEGASYAPLDAERAIELEKLRASPCSHCAMLLACRLRLPGGAP